MEEWYFFVDQHLLNLLSFVIGVLGTLFGIWQWYDSWRTKRLYAHIFKLVERYLEKGITEEQLRELTNKVQEYQDIIRKEIPIAARRAALQDRFEAEMDHLYQAYRAVRRTVQELNQMGVSASIPSELLSQIEVGISPKYFIKERVSVLKTYLVIITTFAAILPRLLSWLGLWMVADYVMTFILILALPVLYQLIRLLIPRSLFLALLYSLLAIGILSVGGLLGVVIWLEYAEGSRSSVIPVMVTLGTFLGITLFGFLAYHKYREYAKVSVLHTSENRKRSSRA